MGGEGSDGVTVEQIEFHTALETLETYSRIYSNLIGMGDSSSNRENEAHSRLSELITGIIGHLYTNARGQI